MSHMRTGKSRTASSAMAVGGGLLAVLALAGCGSSAPTKAQYDAKANAICASAGAKTAPLIREVTAGAAALASGNVHGVPALASAVTHLHETGTQTLAELQKLEQPSGGHAAIESFLTPLGSVVSAIGKAAEDLDKGQAQQALGVLEQIRPTSQQATAAADAYGMTSCGTVLAALA